VLSQLSRHSSQQGELLNESRVFFGQRDFGPEVALYVTRDRCCDFKNMLAKKIPEKIGVFCLNYCYFLQ
jgi:hypothetical protein